MVPSNEGTCVSLDESCFLSLCSSYDVISIASLDVSKMIIRPRRSRYPNIPAVVSPPPRSRSPETSSGRPPRLVP